MRLNRVENGQASAATPNQQREIPVKFYNPSGNTPMVCRINALCFQLQGGWVDDPPRSASIRLTAPTVPSVDKPTRPQSPHAHQAR